MLTLSELNLEYRGAHLSIVYGYIDNLLYLGGTVKSPVSFDITIPWGSCDEGDTIDTYIDIAKSFIDFHHARVALNKVFE